MDKNTFKLSGDEAVAVLTVSRPYSLAVEGEHSLLDALHPLLKRANLRGLIIKAWLNEHPSLGFMSTGLAWLSKE